MDNKTCKACNRNLSVNKFSPSKFIKDGYENKCRECRQKQRSSTHSHTCKYCGKQFGSAKKNTKYCSKQCVGNARKKRVKLTCLNCNEDYEVILSKVITSTYCSMKCKTECESVQRVSHSTNYECDGCGKPIKVIPSQMIKHRLHFCDHKCYKHNIGKFITGENNPNYHRVKFTCGWCGEEFSDTPSSRKGNKTFCSNQCRTKSLSDRNAENTVEKVMVECLECGKAMYKTLRQLTLSKHPCCSIQCSNKFKSHFYVGEKHPLWNKNLTLQEREIGRKYPEYSNWRKLVYKRDEFTCQVCGDNTGSNLVAHHILNYSEHKELRTDVDNGVTLCKSCHVKFHNRYGYTKNTKQQFEEFLTTS